MISYTIKCENKFAVDFVENFLSEFVKNGTDEKPDCRILMKNEEDFLLWVHSSEEVLKKLRRKKLKISITFL